jgi:hypothetical protein
MPTEISCSVYGLDSSTTTPYNVNANPDALDIVGVKDFVLPVYLTVSHALSSDHLPVLIDTILRASFYDPLDAPTSLEGTGPHSRIASKLDCRRIRLLMTMSQSTKALRR